LDITCRSAVSCLAIGSQHDIASFVRFGTQ
jgi:hypothetical protein